MQCRKLIGEGLAKNAAKPVRQSPALWPLAFNLLKLWKNLGDCIAHPLGCAPADRKFFNYLVKAYAGRLGGE